MNWKRSQIPARQTGGNSTWDLFAPPDFQHEMKLNPGQTYQLLDDNGKPLALSRRQYNALLRSCPKPFRVQSRSRSGSHDAPRTVWLSMDPGYWEKIEKQAKK